MVGDEPVIVSAIHKIHLFLRGGGGYHSLERKLHHVCLHHHKGHTLCLVGSITVGHRWNCLLQDIIHQATSIGRTYYKRIFTAEAATDLSSSSLMQIVESRFFSTTPEEKKSTRDQD